jgi:hypothetical protein
MPNFTFDGALLYSVALYYTITACVHIAPLRAYKTAYCRLAHLLGRIILRCAVFVALRSCKTIGSHLEAPGETKTAPGRIAHYIATFSCVQQPKAGRQARMEAGARHERTLAAVAFRVEPVVTQPAPPQTRTCAINASGSSVTRVSARLWRITVLPCMAKSDGVDNPGYGQDIGL